MTPDVEARVVRATTRASLRHALHAVLRAEAGAVALGRLCPRCGSSAHGRPWVRTAAGPAPDVSLAYAEDLAVVAWSWAGRVGVDVERADAAAPDGDLGAWTRHEARLKAGADDDADGWRPLALPAGHVGALLVVGG